LKLHCPVVRRPTGAVGASETVQAEAVTGSVRHSLSH
jgi:hypothetical protein